MVIRLIGAGLPRTGTSSLREALRWLLDAPVYHMSEAIAHPEHVPIWLAALANEPVAWDEFLAGYAAGVDAPFSNCWHSIADAFPDAPVLLSHRGDAEVWYRSMEATVLPRTREMRAKTDDPLAPLFGQIFEGIVVDIDSRDEAIAGYERWLADVRDRVEPHRLVDWQPGDGWEPICEALHVPVPDQPFPHENSTATYLERRPARAMKDRDRVERVRGV